MGINYIELYNLDEDKSTSYIDLDIDHTWSHFDRISPLADWLRGEKTPSSKRDINQINQVINLLTISRTELYKVLHNEI